MPGGITGSGTSTPTICADAGPGAGKETAATRISAIAATLIRHSLMSISSLLYRGAGLVKKSARTRNRWVCWNRPGPAQDRQAAAVPVGHVNQPRVRILIGLPGLATDYAGRLLISGRKVVPDLHWREGVRDIPCPHSLVIPRL